MNLKELKEYVSTQIEVINEEVLTDYEDNPIKWKYRKEWYEGQKTAYWDILLKLDDEEYNES